MPGFRYSAASADGRRLGLALLDVTRGYENLVVPRGLGPTDTATLALVARARHLMRRAFDVADVGDDLAPAVLMRSITESVFTLAWVNTDPELGGIVWILDEIRTRLNQHKEVARVERKARRRARRRGQPIAALTPGQSLGPLIRANVRALTRQRDETRTRAQLLPRYRARLNKLKVDQVTRMPSFEKRAEVGDAELIYSLTYRFDSNSAAHPNPLALEQFLQAANGDIVIRATPAGPRPDPYVVGAVLLLALVELAGERVDHTAIGGELARISAALQALPRP